MRPAGNLADPIGTVPQPRIGRVRLIGTALAVFDRVGEIRLLDMRGQQFQPADPGEIAGPFVDVQGEGLVVNNVDGRDAFEQFGIAEAAFRMPPGVPCEQHVLHCDRRAVAPDRLRQQRIGDRDAILAIGCFLILRPAVLISRQFRAQQADQLPVRVVNGNRPPGHGQHV